MGPLRYTEDQTLPVRPLDAAPPGTPEYGAQRIETYIAFRAWEAEKAETVARLRAQAEDAVE